MRDAKLYEECRSELAAYFRKMLIGPADGAREEFSETDLPTARYIMGVLFPHNMQAESISSEEDDTRVASDEEELPDAPVSMSFQKLPATAGLSFFMSGNTEIEFEVRGAAYRLDDSAQSKGNTAKDLSIGKSKEPGNWKRHPIGDRENPQIFKLEKCPAKQVQRRPVLEGMGELHVIWRSMKGGWLVTATLINASEAEKPDCINADDIQKSIFQAGLRCRPLAGTVEEYLGHTRFSHDQEDEELALQYRDKKTYAVGHGCAAVWETTEKGPPRYVEVEFMPTVEVKPVTTKPDKKLNSVIANVMRLQYLSDDNIRSEDLKKGLETFVDGYESWFKEIEKTWVDEVLLEAKNRITDRIKTALIRMRSGIDCIISDEMVRRAFALSNRAMLMQMVHSQEEYGGGIRDCNEKQFKTPDYRHHRYHDLRWRPFQLAFLLLTIKSIVKMECDERDIVDLIWFPTGGGKTEAYLGLASFDMFYRRLRFKEDGNGTAVFMRYTLRLLTAQQFERAAALICSMERIRKQMTDELTEEFTLGLWIGGTSTPNFYTSASPDNPGAKEVYQRILDEEVPENRLQLQKCPWCGTRIVPRFKNENSANYGINATQTTFSFYCPTSSCDFHGKIPLSVVDQHLYENPPTMLIGTIDKFTQLAWNSDSRAFFGQTTEKRKKRTLPPSLIIQDELHLISGPLGTIAGIYESAIDSVIELLGRRPKIIAATATIRRASDQVKHLYAREVSVFPPPGLSADSSYFANTDKDSPGRLYVGIMGQGHTPMTSLVRVSAVLSQSVMEVRLPEIAVDTWWTQIIYHNSRRELGKTMTLSRDDIPARVKAIASDESNMRQLINVEELSANVSGSRIPEILKLLKTSRASRDVIDILPCTNMISVGVDIFRLGLMLINGQPKTTAEYIQASSRIGRDPERPPGIVVTLYAGTKPRDRSHYESFMSYHSSLYKGVEPTSVTPFAPPARDRALHAAIVILARQTGGLEENEAAASFDPKNPRMESQLKLIEERMQRAEPGESDAIAEAVQFVAAEWLERIRKAADAERPLRYHSKGGHQFASLLCHFSEKTPDCWPTLDSMRHVDQDVQVKVHGEDRNR